MSEYERVLYCAMCKRLIWGGEQVEPNTNGDGVICEDCAQRIQEKKADE